MFAVKKKLELLFFFYLQQDEPLNMITLQWLHSDKLIVGFIQNMNDFVLEDQTDHK